MSTTMPSASSSARRKVASMTYVAPCSRCAGPKVSPRKLWAIIMWSRTVTLNTELLLVIGENVAERRQVAGRQPGQDVGQLLEAGATAEECVEGRVTEQVQRQLQPGGRRPGRATSRCDHADLARPDAQAAGVERGPERQGHVRVAVPAEVQHRPLGDEEIQGLLQSCSRGARVHD